MLEQRPNDPFVLQQLALATYKSKKPSPREALLRAKEILQKLQPETTNDPETLGLWGAVHKRLWELDEKWPDLDGAVASYERGFFLKQDHYNGINLAFLLDLRSVHHLRANRTDEAIADAVNARRIRKEVLRYTQASLANAPADPAKRFWIVASLWEAARGLGDTAAAEEWGRQLDAMPVPGWMQETRREQWTKLEAIQQEYARRMNPQ